MIGLEQNCTSHHSSTTKGCAGGPGLIGSRKWLDIIILLIKLQFFLKCKLRTFEGLLLRLGSLFISNWYFVDHESICLKGNVLKLNNIYTYKDNVNVDIVRLLDVYSVNGYLYCTLYFFNSSKIITVSQIIQSGAYVIWRIMDDREYDELMSRKLWYEVTRDEELLEFDF